MFFLAYHLHWSRDDILDLPTEERWDYVRRLTEQLENETEALQQN